jgi:lysophospholipase L1-like esterase
MKHLWIHGTFRRTVQATVRGIVWGIVLLTAPVVQAQTQFSELLVADGYSYAFGLAAADLDGDGDLDLTSGDIRGKPSRSALFWFENQGPSRFVRRAICEAETGWFERHSLGDINGDARPDVAIVDNQGGRLLWFANPDPQQQGAPQAAWQGFLITTQCPRAYDVVLLDADGDGDLDAAASGYASNRFTWYENPGRDGWEKEWVAHRIDEKMSEARTIRVADFNQDGHPDLLGASVGVENVAPDVVDAEQHGGRVVWYENPGPPATGRWTRHIIDDRSRAPIHGQPFDLDLDGDLDVVMAHGMRRELISEDHHEVVWYENAGAAGRGEQWLRHTIARLPFAFEAAAADLDGDGDIDVAATAWARGDRLVWYENSGNPRDAWSEHVLKRDWFAANQLIIADLNGDGRPDIAATSDTGSSRVQGANELRCWHNVGTATARQVTIVTLGDSITKGVRSGVAAEDTFSAILQEQLRERGVAANVVNLGIGGERTDQALQRIPAVLEPGPQLVTIMYGTNDSYVDREATNSRLSPAEYRANLTRLVRELLLQGVEPIVMTEPRWALDAAGNGLGEHPNLRLAEYMQICREVAAECRVPLVDHFARWSQAEADGQVLRDWTTDGCHPNARGHRALADALLPVVASAVSDPRQPARVQFDVQLQTVLEHDDGKFLWFHPRVTALPRPGHEQPSVLMSLQKHLITSDHYSGLSILRTDDLGRTWSDPDPRPELDWVTDGDVDVAVADVTPGWHPATGKVILVGAQVRYSREGAQLDDKPRAHQTAYAVLDPATGTCSAWQRLEMPADEVFNYARSACAQFVIEPDGTVLLPYYIAATSSEPFAATVVRCTFDGRSLNYVEHGDVLRLNVERGLYEPSLIRLADRYYLTVRNDLDGYVTTSGDGLHFRPIKRWMFDDGQPLGSYNTQQHWLANGDSLFLVYTRRGLNNDHIFRHRAPLLMAQVDPQRLCVLRDTEQVLVPERGATLGNFGAAAIHAGESWVTVGEGIWNDEARQRGAKGAVFVARILWPR